MLGRLHESGQASESEASPRRHLLGASPPPVAPPDVEGPLAVSGAACGADHRASPRIHDISAAMLSRRRPPGNEFAFFEPTPLPQPVRTTRRDADVPRPRVAGSRAVHPRRRTLHIEE